MQRMITSALILTTIVMSAYAADRKTLSHRPVIVIPEAVNILQHKLTNMGKTLQPAHYFRLITYHQSLPSALSLGDQVACLLDYSKTYMFLELSPSSSGEPEHRRSASADSANSLRKNGSYAEFMQRATHRKRGGSECHKR